MAERPTGTVTFLFTDVEGSTRLWEDHPEAMRDALKRHDELLTGSVEAHRGYVVKTTGDGIHAAFATADDAVAAAIDAQRALTEEVWGSTGPLRVRMGLHTGAAEHREGDYYGPALNRAARLMAAAHGGQIVISNATEELVRDALASAVEIEDLGEHRLRGLDRPERVFQVDAPELPSRFPSLRSLDVIRTNIPARATTFVGREAQIADITTAMEGSRIVTLTGVGGVGKTRLALEVAERLGPAYADGCWLVELAPALEPDAIVEVVAAALGVVPRQGSTLAASVADGLRDQHLLLVLDNCEHLLEAVARFVEETVVTAPNVAVLATSREGLAVGGERMIAVPALELPEEETEGDHLSSAESVRLFEARAAEAKAGFRLTSENAPAVYRLVRRLDGIPLAIELAAARVRSLTPAELAERLDERFRLLAGGRRTAIERHQTLQRAIDWSYDLLPGPERCALNRAAVFAGDFPLIAAEAVVAGEGIEAADVVELLGRLVDKSLVLAEDQGGVTRYRLLETIRSYAQDRLEAAGEAELLRRRHAEHYVAFATAAGQGLRGAEEAAWSARIDVELDNLRAALSWSMADADADLALRLVAPLAVYGTSIGYASNPWAESVLVMEDAPTHPLYPEVLAWAGWAAVIAGDVERGVRLAGEAVQRAADGKLPAASMCRVLFPATGVAMYAGDPDEAARRAGRLLSLGRSFDDDYYAANALAFSAYPFLMAREWAEAMLRVEEGLIVARRLGNPTAVTYAALMAGSCAMETDPDRARALFDESLEAATSVGNQMAMGVSVAMSALLHADSGDGPEGARRLLRAVDHAYRVGDSQNLRAVCLHVAVPLAAEAGADDVAAILCGATSADAVVSAPIERQLTDAIAAVRTRLGEEAFVAGAARGAAMDDDELVACLRREIGRLVDVWEP